MYTVLHKGIFFNNINNTNAIIIMIIKRINNNINAIIIVIMIIKRIIKVLIIIVRASAVLTPLPEQVMLGNFISRVHWIYWVTTHFYISA